jgi:hypothetical protein
VLMACQSLLIHVEVNLMFQSFLYQVITRSWMTWISKLLHTLITLEFLFSDLVRRGQILSQQQYGLLHSILEDLQGSIAFKPSRRWVVVTSKNDKTKTFV